MNNLVFTNNEFGNIRVMEENGKILFCGKDIAVALGYTRPNDAISAHCKGAVKRRTLTKGGKQELNFITEGDIYRLIVKSKLPSAEKFERWVFDEVLPTIRKTGGYVSNEDMFINTYLPYADDNTKNLFRTTLHTINQLNAKIEQDKPLVDFANHIQVSEDCIDMKAMAKIAAKNGIKIGRNRLFEFLRKQKVLDGTNIPYQRYMELQPWFEVKEGVFQTPYMTRITKTTYIKPKGQIGIVNLLKKYYR